MEEVKRSKVFSSLPSKTSVRFSDSPVKVFPSVFKLDVLRKGGYHCCYCSRTLKQLYLRPIREKVTGDFVYCDIPYCRPECVLGDLPANNFQLRGMFHARYGDITPPTPREMLFVPNGISLFFFHKRCDQGRQLSVEDVGIRSLMAPCTLQEEIAPRITVDVTTENHQLTQHLVQQLHTYQENPDVAMGPAPAESTATPIPDHPKVGRKHARN